MTLEDLQKAIELQKEIKALEALKETIMPYTSLPKSKDDIMAYISSLIEKINIEFLNT